MIFVFLERNTNENPHNTDTRALYPYRLKNIVLAYLEINEVTINTHVKSST
jgi:hypothetical protein